MRKFIWIFLGYLLLVGCSLVEQSKVGVFVPTKTNTAISTGKVESTSTVIPTITKTVVPTEIQIPTETKSVETCKVVDLYGLKNNTVYLREGGGNQYKVLGVVTSGEILIVIGENSEWIETSRGWIYFKYCEKDYQ